MPNKAQKIANASLKKKGGTRAILRRSPVTGTRRSWSFDKKTKKK
jgi:hypothetical protein